MFIIFDVVFACEISKKMNYASIIGTFFYPQAKKTSFPNK